jgi:hypothetical protein
VCAELGRLGSGVRREAADQVGLARPLGVVGEPGHVVARLLGQRLQQGEVPGGPAVRRDLRLHGAPGQLVPEAQRVAVGDQQPGGDQLVEGRQGGAGRPAQGARVDP